MQTAPEPIILRAKTENELTMRPPKASLEKSAAERRRFARTHVSFKVRLANNDHAVEANLLNLSRGGMMVRCVIPAELHAQLVSGAPLLRAEVSGRGVNLRVPGHPAWVFTETTAEMVSCRIGIEFELLSGRESEQIETLLKSLRRG